MSYGLETGGRILGGLFGGVGGALQQGANYGAAGVVAGAAGGALVGTAGVVTGPGELVIEPAAIGTGAVIGGGLGAAYGAGKGLIEGVPAGADKGAEYGRRLSDWITQMTSAQARQETRRRTVEHDLTTACASCGCAALANGAPGSQYRGGAHAFMQEPGSKTQSHHMPANSVSPLTDDMGPAIQMDRTDHYTTPSYGRNIFAPFMRSQGQLANTGQFMTAFAVDAAAVRAQFPGKYDAAIAQTLAYATCLQSAGLIS